MKKLVSIFIVLVLMVSLFAVSTVAFAEELADEQPATHTVTFNSAKFWEVESIVSTNKIAPLSDKFTLDNSWLQDVDTVKGVFEGIVYAQKVAETTEESSEEKTEEPKFELEAGSDKIFIEYCSATKDYKENWRGIGVANDNVINISTAGWWSFRYVVKDSKGTASSEGYLAKTDKIDIYFCDESAPIIKLTSDMQSNRDNGILVGKTYTISSSVSVTDNSTTTTSYVVYKKVNGAWTDEPILDSKERVVAEGFDGITASGVITMKEEDVLPDNEPVYKVVYKVKDAFGYESEALELTLFAKVEEKTPMPASQVWTIVLYCVAGVSFVGIVVVLFIKPKEEPAQQIPVVKKPEDSEE